MSEEEITNDQEQAVPAQEEETVSTAEVKEQPKSVDHNWAQANEVLRLQKQRIEELEARLHQPLPKVEAEKDEFADLDPDDALTVSQARRLAESLAEKKAREAAKQVIDQYMRENNVSNDEQRMRSKHDDYDYVVETFAIPLIKSDPALAHKIQNSRNPAETAYKLGKLSDQYEETMTKKETSPKAEKILKNASRPTSGNAVSAPLKGQADNFSKMSKEDVWNMSQKYAKGF